MRVLVADDNREIRWALRLALLELCDEWGSTEDGVAYESPAECTALEAGDAAETLILLKNRDIDVLLLDWELPGLDGVEALPRIKALAPGCTVIAMSGRPEAHEASLSAGADHFVSKNDPPSKLLGLLHTIWLDS